MVESMSIWILDSGATDHMTPCSVSFDSYGKRNKEQLITVANGQVCPSTHMVKEIKNNLLQLRMVKDLATGKTILTAKEQSGLYFLEFDDQSNPKIMNQQVKSETWAKSQIWLHHQRLGHPSFSLIKSLFPHLFTKSLLSLLIVIFVNFQNTIVHLILLVIKRVFLHLL
ncbi:uncharacterized protein LOC128197742 isoform X2 [Vigna angularis]|uniref:uncharacterized protein LOC128197742 isoform X2 n=1 Tax=Phaseolus angularis TaxID=3914 RepID=UPI0022B476D2|nr:uncharacterized protein LOC128197742 isoform X2 [Vigna angularis]